MTESGKVWRGGTPGIVRGPGSAGSVGDCGVDTNDLVWLYHDTLAGAAEIFELTINPPKRKFYYLGPAALSAGHIFVSLNPFDTNLVSGGVLIGTPTQCFFMVPYDAVAVNDPQRWVVEFCKPISKIYVVHPDFGVGQILQFLASDDVVLGLEG